MSKPKWIAESTTNELAQEAFNQLSELEPNKQTKRAIKALEEVIERTAQEDKETVEDSLDTVIQMATLAKDLYNQEVEAIGIVPETEEADEEVDEVDEDEEDEDEIDLEDMNPKELKAFAKENEIDIDGIKGKAKLVKAIQEALESDDEDEDEEEEDEEVEIDLETLTLKELRGIAKEYGITSKGKTKEDLIDAIAEAVDEDDEEDEDEDEDEIDYESLSLKELKALAKSRGLKVPSKPRKPKLIELLETDDEN